MSYRFQYDERGLYGNVVTLIREYAVGRGLHLDIGCGWGAIAEPVAATGLTYLGFDLDSDAVAGVRARGFEAYEIDLADPTTAANEITAAIAGRRVASITVLDTLEHLTTDPDILSLLRTIAVQDEPVPLVISVPNVSHVDVAAKLLSGRWDYTETGLLDHTHLRFFTGDGLTRLMELSGWRQVGVNDFALPVSDQHFPDSSIVLSKRTALGGLLHAVRDSAGSGAITNQFVRAYLPGPIKSGTLQVDRNEPSEWALTVMVRTQGKRPHTLRDTLLCLIAQTVQDFEVIVLAHDVSVEEQVEVEQAVVDLPQSIRDRVRVLAVHGGGRAHPLNQGVVAARGRYVVVLDDDDTVFAHWVETFRDLATDQPGRLLRAVAVSQPICPEKWSDGRPGFRTVGAVRLEFPREFDLFAHLAQNRTPFMCWALPRALFTELGLRFDDTLSVCEDWDVVMRGAFVCGVAASEQTVAIYRRWQDGDASHLVHEREDWESDAERIVGRLHQQATVLAPGAARRLRELVISEAHSAAVIEQRDELQRTLHEQRIAWDERGDELHEARLEINRLSDLVGLMAGSSSWRLTSPIRKIAGLARARRADVEAS